MGIEEKMVVFLLLLMAAVFVAQPSEACEFVNVGLWSHHFDNGGVEETEDGYYNEDNNRLGCETKNFNVGYFENSYGWDTYYLTKNLYFTDTENLKIGFEYGLVHGYREKHVNIDGVSFMFLPHLDMRISKPVWLQFYGLWGEGFAFGFKWEV